MLNACSAKAEFCCHTFVIDRKSTRLNSSHSQISYAVFCLKKKKINLASIITFESMYCNTIYSRRLYYLHMLECFYLYFTRHLSLIIPLLYKSELHIKREI